MNLPGPTARRATDNELALAYADASVRMVEAGHLEEALACQWVSDLHKLSASLWSRASNSTDPMTAFFAQASRAAKAALGAQLAEATSPSGALSAARAAWVNAAHELNIPLVFRPASHLQVPGSIDLAAAGQRLTGGRPAGLYLEQEIASEATGSASDAARVALVAYLVQVCEQTGEASRLTALAAWSLMRAKGVESEDTAVVLRAAREVLGPVGSVRVMPYLEYAGVVEVPAS